ncbi:hypothetical protein [Thermomonas mangrovi]|nr:hypothetical protein [Thermomonas mangrovi]
MRATLRRKRKTRRAAGSRVWVDSNSIQNTLIQKDFLQLEF